MKKALLVIMMILMAVVLSGTAYAQNYKVKSGDTLWDISKKVLGKGNLWKQVAKVNGIENPKALQIGQILTMPEISEKKKIKKVHNIKPKLHKIEKNNSKPQLGSRENPAPYTDEEVGDNPWKGGIIKALKLLEIEIPEGVKPKDIRYSYEGEDFLSKGEIIYMLSGKDIVKYYSSQLSSEMAKVVKLGIVIDGEKIAYLYQKPECGNWLRRIGRVTISEPAKKPESPEFGISRPGKGKLLKKPVSSFAYKPLRDIPSCRDFELTPGTGLLFSDEGLFDWWYYAEGIYWDSCWDWSGGIGFFLKGDDGDVESGYEWNNFAIGPQVGLRYQNYLKDKRGVVHPYGFTNKLRLLYSNMEGMSSDSGYKMSQDDIMLGLYSEYVQQIEQGKIAGISFEGWISLHSEIHSTWSGDSPSNQARISLNLFIQDEISEDWRLRKGWSSFYQWSDYVFGTGPYLEFRYNEWFMIGGSAFLLFNSGGDLLYGPSARIEMGNYVRYKRQEKILEDVWVVDEEGKSLEYKEEKKKKEGEELSVATNQM